MKMRFALPCVKFALLWPGAAAAHVSQQGFVLLLPTDFYAAAGVAVVAATALLLALLPQGTGARLFAWRAVPPLHAAPLRHGLSLASLALLAAMIWIGITGPRDPLANLMPQGFWTLGWMALLTLAGLLGNLWGWINPWTGLYALAGRPAPLLRLPAWLGRWPAALLLVGYTGFLLADVAPDDPARLARLVALYWAAMFAGLLLCGPAWLRQVELGHAIFDAYGRLAPLSLSGGGLGVPGWQVLRAGVVPGMGVFALALLATGSFDGLNETFWWLALIGVNPLEFPGRSAVVRETLTGLAVSVAGLVAVFAAVVWAGLALARARGQFGALFERLALSLLPIAFAYHVAHYLPSFLVNIQYTVAALSDPLARGDDFLGLQPFYVTTGFFNVLSTVRVIWLTQAGLVVLGHVWSVLLAHRLAGDMLPGRGRAVRATLPLSLFMVGYTFLGLWLLAAPRGA